MSSKRNLLFAMLSLATLSSAAVPFTSTAAEEVKAPTPALTLAEILAKRKEVREELMLPSLDGIRGLSFRVVGYKDYEPLEKLMGTKLQDLKLPTVRFVEMKEGQKPIDAIVQVTFFKAGNYNIAELNVIQWVSLLRDAKIKVRAITYKDRIVVPHGKPAMAVEHLTNQFVIDMLKANQKGTTTGDKTISAADDKEPLKKDSSTAKKSKKAKAEN